MKIIVEVDKSEATPRDTVSARVLLINDSSERVIVNKRLLVGPSLAAERAISMAPAPVAVEPNYEGDDDSAAQITLAPGAIYGRTRSYSDLPPGTHRFHGYLLRTLTHALLPAGPADQALAAEIAEPATVVVT